MLRIAIITFQYAHNYGSVLQAYALKTLLENKKYKVSVINFIHRGDFEQYKLFRKKYYYKHPWGLVLDVIYLKQNKNRIRNFESFVNENLNLTPKKYFNSNDMKELNKEFDIFICGSDQIWNLDCTGGVEPAYFLDFADKNKLKIAYAPSLSHQKFSKNYNEDLKKALRNIDYISIREKTTLPLIEKLTDKTINVVLDPTLLLEKEYYEKLLPSNSLKEEKYIFVYMLEYNRELIKFCNKYSKEHKIKLIYITNRRYNGISMIKGENAFEVGPDRFLEYILNAEIIITNSFHATVFSVIFHKQFIVFKTKRSSSRMKDLLLSLGIKGRIYGENLNINNTIDYSKIDEILSNLRKTSLMYIEKALKRE